MCFKTPQKSSKWINEININQMKLIGISENNNTNCYVYPHSKHNMVAMVAKENLKQYRLSIFFLSGSLSSSPKYIHD